MKKGKPTYEELESKVLELERFISDKLILSNENIFWPNEERIKDHKDNNYNALTDSNTKNRKSRTALRVSEKLYQSLMDNIDAGIVIHAPDTSIIISNPKASVLLGLSEEQMYGKLAYDPQWRFIYENGEPIPIDKYPVNQIIKENKSLHNLVLGVNRPVTNDIVWLIVNGFSVSNQEDEIIEIIISFIDITEQKNIEQDLLDSELKYRNLVENSTVGVYRTRINGEILFANNTLLKILGYNSMDSLLATNSIITYKDPKQREFIINQLLKHGEISDHELSINTADGFEKILLTSVKLEGDILTGTVIDITGRKKVEEALGKSRREISTLMNNMPGMVYYCMNDRNWTLKFASEGSFDLTGYLPDELIGSKLISYNELIHPDDRDMVWNSVQEAITKKTSYSIEYRIITRTKVVKFVWERGQGLYNTDNALDHLEGFILDITERKQSEEALYISEQNWRTLVNTVPDYIALHDEEGRYLFLNHYAEGFSEKDVIGKNLFDFIPEENQALYKSNFEACIKTQQTQKFINKAYGNNKTTRTYDCYMVPIINKDESIYVLAIAKDITEQKNMEDSLRNSEAHFRLLTEDVSDVVWKQDSDNRFTYISPADERLRGFKSEEMIGRHVSEILTAEGFALVKDKMFDRYNDEQTENKTGSLVFEVQQICKDGSYVWTEVISTAEHDDEGKITGYHGISRDITERKKAEDALRDTNHLLSQFIEHSPILAYIKEVTPTESRVLIASENFKEMTGIPGSLMAGKTMKELFPADFADKISADDWEVVSAGKEIKIEEELNGRFYTSIKYPIRTGSKNLLAGYTIDNTERKKFEIALEKNFKELEELNAEKDKFFSIIAHDLRSPFNIFLGFTQLMVEDLPKLRLEEIQKIALLMRNSANNLYILLDNLLEWSRMQRGITHFEPYMFLVKLRIKESIQSSLEMADKKGIEFEINIPDEMTIFADENMFGSIIRNLISNATKFTSKGGKIIISASKRDHELKFSVSDTGIGMDNVLLGRLFHLDDQSSRKGTEGEPSTGLGLIICKDFVEKHGGKIWAESEEGKGSIFHFTIPC
jgi:PAS domain S-box-containing protein